MKTTDALLNRLNPDNEVIDDYLSAENKSLKRIIQVISTETPEEMQLELAKVCLKMLQSVNKTRTNLKSEVSLTVKLFHDVSENKEELRAYIKSTYPKMLERK